MELALWEDKDLLHFVDEKQNGFPELNWNRQNYPVFPQMSHYKLLLQQYPDSKFILCKRDISKHIDSIDRWNNLRQRIVDLNLPYLPKGRGSTDQELKEWIEDHYGRVEDFFKREAPGKLLSVWLEDNPVESLANFLHCYGEYKLPHHNSNNKQ